MSRELSREISQVLRPALIAFSLLGAAALPSYAQQIAVSKENRTIAVTTSAEATVDADTASVHIGFVAYGPDQQSAYAAGSNISNAIIATLTSGGVDRGQIESDNQNIAPVEQYANQNWTPQQKAERQFQVTQSWSVKTSAKNAAQVLDLAIKAGANQSGQIEWDVADQDALQAKAAGLALGRAREIAQQMTGGLNSTLGPLLYASNEAPVRTPEPLIRAEAMTAMKSSSHPVAPLSLAGRKVSRTATVYAVFAIQ